jgi:hypothetical protein
MKRCPYCGKEYPDEASECAIDGQPLAPFPPDAEPTKDDPCDEPKMTVVRTFISHEAAQLASSNLDAHGIGCWIRADDCGGMYPNLTAPGGVRLLVQTADAEQAIALLNTQASPAELDQIEAEAVAAPSPETVPLKKLAPGQILFGIIFGVILGIILCLFYQSASEFGEKTDYHYYNGKRDKAWIYRNGRLVEFMQDRNFDGKWDHWTYFEHERTVRSEYDNNFDGNPDEIWTFSEGGTDTLQRDTDFNGKPDVFCTYKNSMLQQVDIRPNDSKFSITRELYHNGVLTEIERGGDSNGNFKSVVRYDPFFNPIGTGSMNTNTPIAVPLSPRNSE